MTTKTYEEMTKQELIEELENHEASWNIQEYKDGYWINFVVSAIMDGKIDAQYWAKRMPEVDPYPELIEAFVERVKNTKYNLTKEELQEVQDLNRQRDEQQQQSQTYERELLLEQLRGKAETKH